MNTSFENESELALQNLPNGLLVVTKGQAVNSDKLGKTWLTASSGTGITLASGNVAVAQPSASTKSEISHDHAGTYSDVGHTHSYLPLTGGTLSGRLITTHNAEEPPFWNNAGVLIESAGASSDPTLGFHDVNAAQAGTLHFAVGRFYFSGSVTASDFVATSDRRLKDDIEPLETNRVLELNTYTYTMEGNPNIGVIADEVKKVAPELVSVIDDEGHEGVKYNGLVAMLIDVVKQQEERIYALEAIIHP
jgi:hypothetical protein